MFRGAAVPVEPCYSTASWSCLELPWEFIFYLLTSKRTTTS